MKRITILVVLAAPLLVGGCFSYVPVESPELAVDDRVRARVTESEAQRLEEWLGSQRSVLTGVVVALRPDTLALRVPVATGGTGGPRLAQDVEIPELEIRELEVRVLERGRTAALAVGTAALMGYILYEALARPDPAGIPGENPPPVNQLIRGRTLSLPLP